MTESAAQPPETENGLKTVSSRPAQIATVLYIATTLVYLWWRSTSTVNMDALYVSLPFLAADFLGFGFFLLFVHNLWARTERQPGTADPRLTVDVFIPTYNEDLDVLRPTIEAALAMDYPHVTYVLDDGRRPEVRALCQRLGARYLTRPDNRGAKAGNINAALPHTDGDLIAFFDADHAPLRNFLTALIGYFSDERVALVQAPQAYYNLDSFQHGSGGSDRPWHEQSVFYDVMMPGKDRLNAAFWCGSSAIVRRRALLEVGGVDTRTVTEDMHTSMKLHAAGWASVYDPRELAVGIAPDDATGFLTQRSRWAKGALQILRRDNPLIKPGLTRGQRLAYFAAVAYVFEYIPRTIYLVTPIVALLFGDLPLRSVGWLVLLTILGHWMLGVLTSRLLTLGRNPYLAAERYHVLKLWVMLGATLTLLWPRGLKFNVTPKSGDGTDHRMRQLLLIRGQVAIGALSALAVVWAVLGYLTGAPWELTGLSLVVTAGWALVTAGMVASLAFSVIQHHHRRRIYRFPLQTVGSMTSPAGSSVVRVVDISAVGLGWESALDLPLGAEVEMRFVLDGSIATRLRLQNRRELGASFRYGGEFHDLPDNTRRQLVRFLYQHHAPAMFAPPHTRRAEAAEQVELQAAS